MAFDAQALAEIIETGGVPYKENAISFVFSCPRCQKLRRLYIRKRDGRFRCFRCGPSFTGRAEWALRELFDEFDLETLQEKLYGGNVPDHLPNELVLDLHGPWGDDNECEDDEILGDPIPREVFWPPQFATIDDSVPFARAWPYLQKRGITPEHVRAYDIHFDPPEQRVIFPVKVNGVLVGWQGRYIHMTEIWNEMTERWRRVPKILTSTTLQGTGGHWLMFQDRLLGSKHCVLAEGPVSAIKAHLCGGNVASMGKGVSKNQLATILRYGISTLYLALDPDAAEDITRVVREMEESVEVRLLLPPQTREDLGDATPEEVYEQFQHAPRLSGGTLMFSLGNKLVL